MVIHFKDASHSILLFFVLLYESGISPFFSEEMCTIANPLTLLGGQRGCLQYEYCIGFFFFSEQVTTLLLISTPM